MKIVKQLLTLGVMLAVLGLPFACAEAYVATTGWTMIEGIWYYVDESGELLDYDPYLFTLPPVEGESGLDLVPETTKEPENTASEEQPESEPVKQSEPEMEKLPVPEAEIVPESEPVKQSEPEPEEGEPQQDGQTEFEPVKQSEPEPAGEAEPEKQSEPTAIIPEMVEELPEEPEEPVEPEKLTVSIYAAYSGDEPRYGSTIQLLSLVGGASEDASLSYQWQYKDASGAWQDVPGANDSAYAYVLGEENEDYAWRLVVTP